MPFADCLTATVDSSPTLGITPLGMPWVTIDPFLLCVHHDDRYPPANGRYGPAAPLAGHRPGQDFFNADGWRMYHGTTVPGFPPHPHRGFETVTIVRRGWIDHSDSLGAAARYGPGDAQWLTAGRGVVHAEMFPLLDTGASNPLDFFQVWLNLPAASKFAAPRFSMYRAEDIPRRRRGRAHAWRSCASPAGRPMGCAARLAAAARTRLVLADKVGAMIRTSRTGRPAALGATTSPRNGKRRPKGAVCFATSCCRRVSTA